MRGLRYDRILAGTALALILAAPCTASAQKTAAVTAATGEAAVPMPEGGTLPPPTSSDVKGTTPALAPGDLPPDVPAAAEPAAPIDPYAALDPADRAIAEKVHDLLNAKVDKIFGIKKERAAVEAFYESRKHALVWLDKGVVTPRAKAVIARLKTADTDGLDVNDYRTPNFEALQTPEALAEAELRLTAVVFTYARHVQAGRFPYARISKDIDLPQQPPEPADVLAKVADAGDAAKALDEFSPPQEAYKKLKAMLAEMRAKTGSAANQFEDGPVLKVNKVPMEDARVPLLRVRLDVAGDKTDPRYDAKVAEAVKKFQRTNDLPVTGALDPKTVKELNGPPRDKQIDTIVINMERWRWYPRDLGTPAHVVVNIPEFMLRVFKDGNVAWTTRVVVGQPGSHATPLLHAPMRYITVNPTWNVPPSIVQNEYLPALAQDPTVLQRMGLKVEYNRDGSVHISQPPGDGNALGRLRFNFPNRFLVYQHDTPDKHLFAHESRAYSHGCMRVQDPPKYAEVLLNIVRPHEGWTAERVKKMFGSAEQDIQFPTLIPVNLTYQTAFVDDEGHLQTRRDIYNLDSRMLSAIKTERGMVEMAQERPKERPTGSTTAQRRPQPRQLGFFEALFGGGNNNNNAARPTPPNRVR
jgi:murein L,D-transpeptidase YcbB/YkuD